MAYGRRYRTGRRRMMRGRRRMMRGRRRSPFMGPRRRRRNYVGSRNGIMLY